MNRVGWIGLAAAMAGLALSGCVPTTAGGPGPVHAGRAAGDGTSVPAGRRLLLPGSRYSVAEAMKDFSRDVYASRWYHPSTRLSDSQEGFAFAAVCEPLDPPRWGSSHGVARTWQKYKVLLPLAGGPRIGEEFDLHYQFMLIVGDDRERAIELGEHVIWLVHHGTMGELVGVKALPDTPENRKAVGWNSGMDASKGRERERVAR